MKFKNFISGISGFALGEGNVTSQSIADINNQASQLISKGLAKEKIKPSVTSIIEAQQIATWMNDYRGFFESIVSTNVPRSSQIKIVNKLGLATVADGYIFFPDGKVVKYIKGVQDAPIRVVNATASQRHIAEIVAAYGDIALSDRQRFLVGFFLDNTKGNLLTHMERYFSEEVKYWTLGYVSSAINNYIND